ncbi:MAG: hypothetical protein JSV43_06295 [Methanobacteriota archaeon]|nr:MAG: hypothetical protein JSV43_06295 [Euryarchaeota archaeon]
MGVTAAKPSDQQNEGLSAFERWINLRSHISALEDSPAAFGNDDSPSFSYKDAPYPQVLDDGAIKDGFRDDMGNPLELGDYCISDIICWNVFAGYPFSVTSGGGDFLAGHAHESYLIGDQNGNGVLEWVVFYFYIPWMKDGIDNDGDGCADEKMGICDFIPDAMVIYETGGLPNIGGEDGTLLVNVDWYSDIDATEIYRVFVSPRWKAYQLREITIYPDVVGEFISYYAYESQNGVNANPEMDSDMSDGYVGVIDARGFPGRAPVDYACAAGMQAYMGHTFLRDDGIAIIAFYLYEYYDDHDWNGDGDTSDYVTAYFALNQVAGNCRERAVNTGVYGYFPTTSGSLITPMYTSESGDRRDWNGNGVNSGYVKLYHDVDTTLPMAGHVYTSFTWTAPVPAWGFGWWAIYDTTTFRTYPMKFGVGFQVYVGAARGYYRTNIVLTAEEDGNRHTLLPRYDIAYGYPSQVLGGECLWITSREYYLRMANVWLMPGPFAGDANGDGNTFGFAVLFFCPYETGGGGRFIIEPTSKYAKGLYLTPITFVLGGYLYYPGTGGVIDRQATIPLMLNERDLGEDCNGDGGIGSNMCCTYYQFYV